MEISTEYIRGVMIAEIPVRELDASNAGDLKGAMAKILEKNSKVVMDVARMQFVDSSGLGAMLACLRQANERGGDLKVCCMTRQVRTAFELVRMHRLFDIFETRDEALNAFNAYSGV